MISNRVMYVHANTSLGGNYMSEQKKNTMSDSLQDDNGIEILKAVIKSKEGLFRKAFGSEKMDIIVDDEKITFPWFSIMDGTEANAYSTFIEHLCNHAKTLKVFFILFQAAENRLFPPSSGLLVLWQDFKYTKLN